MKLKRLLSALVTAACIFGMTAAQPLAEEASAEQANKLIADYAGMLGLTPEQRLEDYDYLWDTLEDSYLYFGFLERSGVDVAAIREEGRKNVENANSDMGLYYYSFLAVSQLGGAGHLSFLNPQMHQMLSETYQVFTKNSPEAAETYNHWINVLLNEKSKNAYQKTWDAIQSLWAQPETSQQAVEESPAQPANVTTAILTEGETAYMKIKNMRTDYETDRETIFNFYQEAADCENLIIDISENGGGNSQYWTNLIAAPNITKPTKWGGFMLFKDSENNRPYLERFGAYDRCRPISELPELPQLQPSDVQRADYFVEEYEEIPPLTGQKAYKGKIWLLVGPTVYSSAEMFAMFCKQSGFATLVGTPTGGDGLGSDPVYCVMPNSGFIARYSCLTGLNPNGGLNEEFGTKPDITIKKGETPLQACLRVIAEQKIQ